MKTQDEPSHHAETDAILSIGPSPIRFLFSVLMATGIFVMGMVWHLYHSYQSNKINREKEIRISELQGIITHLDEVLTMSARMAAATGDLSWEDRYNQFVQPLDDAIKEAMAIYPGTYEPAGQTNVANLKLVDMEMKSFDLVRKGHQGKARTVLFSKAYDTQKKIYAEGMVQFTDRLRDKIQKDLRLERTRAVVAISLFVLIFPLLVIAWTYVIRILRRWRAALVKNNHQLAERTTVLANLNFTLDQKVTERTAELAQKNENLQSEIAQRKQMERALIQSEKLSAVGQLAAGVAHEINNPLGIILGFAQSIKSQIQTDAPSSLGLEFIEKEALRCKELVQKLLVFSRSSKTDQHEMLDFPSIVEESLTLVQTQSRIKNIEITKKIDPNLPKISANKTQVQQIIFNLCNNAMDAMPDGGILGVRLEAIQRHGQNWIALIVSDTGSGIPKEIQDKIFDPFFTTKEVGKGTGLGLSLIHEIVQNHHGIIDVISENGKGATFTVCLPQSGALEKAA